MKKNLNPYEIAKDVFRTKGRSLKNVLARGGVGNVVVLESDDWGSQRVPSADIAKQLLSKGLLDNKLAYDRETLETADDLIRLNEVLHTFRGSDGSPAIMTCFVNPANPDFNKIRESDYTSYFWEPTRATHERRGDLDAVRDAWAEGFDAEVLDIEYHGREHLQVRSWLKELQNNNLSVRAAFDFGYYSVALNSTKPITKGFRAAYYFDDFSEIEELENIIISGADIFEQEYSRRPNIFCPPNGIFHPKLYSAVKKAGCDWILRHSHNLEPDGKGNTKNVWGKRGVKEAGLIGYGRNALFEPEQGYGVDHTLRQVHSAFAWGVPAIISTHRVNYAGGIDPSVRDRGAKALSDLLKIICSKWPDVRFMSSSRLQREFSSHD